MRLGISNLFRRRPEVRESYTDQIISRIMASASGASEGGGLAVIETAARIYGSGLASASVSPSNLALSAITPSVLDGIGRALCREGESLHAISIRNGQVVLTPTASWTVLGDDDPSSWRYQLLLSGPSTSRTITLPGSSVLHCRYSPHPSRPWAGRSPLLLARDTWKAASRLEHAISEEMTFTQKQLLSPRRNPGDYGGMTDLTPELIEKIVQSFSDHTGAGALIIPGDLEASRLGPNPPATFPDIRSRLQDSILSACGIPPSLISAIGTGTAAREAFRQVLHSLLKPLGAIVVEELQAKIDPDAALDFADLRAGDIAGISRAAGSLVKAGYTPASAAEVVGLTGIEVSS